MKEKNGKKQIHLTIEADADVLSFFLPLLNHGFDVCITEGVSIKEFLCDQIGLHPDYLENRIQTLFVDGKAVDDFGGSPIQAGSVMALSGAMPGLAGATLRRGGFFGRMRGEISHPDKPISTTCGEGHVTVKLFNLILKEAGPLFLKHGVLIRGQDFYHRLSSAREDLKIRYQIVELDGISIAPETLPRMDWHALKVFFSVH